MDQLQGQVLSGRPPVCYGSASAVINCCAAVHTPALVLGAIQTAARCGSSRSPIPVSQAGDSTLGRIEVVVVTWCFTSSQPLWLYQGEDELKRTSEVSLCCFSLYTHGVVTVSLSLSLSLFSPCVSWPCADVVAVSWPCADAVGVSWPCADAVGVCVSSVHAGHVQGAGEHWRAQAGAGL